MIWRRTAGRLLSATILAAAFSSTTLATSGCRTTSDDVQRWAKTKSGPRKLVAVLTHDKYEDELRVEAAMTLVRMKPRNGQRIGIENMVQALNEMPAEPRKRIVSALMPKLQEEMKKPPPAAQGESAGFDESYVFKDAAYEILNNEKDLVENDELRNSTKAAMKQWAMTDFANRLDNSSQAVGMETLLRYLGKDGVKDLPKLIKPDARRISNMAALIAELGDDATKEAASKALVAVAKEVDSDRWRKKKGPEIDAANKASGFTDLKKEQFEAQVAAFQEEELLRVFSSMKKVGRAPVVEYLLAYAANKDAKEKRRVSALAALANNISKKNKAHVDQILELASADETPDAIRSVALARAGELPREVVAEKMYGLFKHEKWQIRWVGAELILKMSSTKDLDEFFTRLSKDHEGMAISEPVVYGMRIGEMKGDPKPATVIDKYLANSYVPAVRLSALGYYMQHGTKEQLAKVSPYENDSSKVPECKEDADGCEWVCVVGEGKKAEQKEIKTLGDFVKHCVKPQMEKRSEADQKKKEEAKEKKEQEKKKDEQKK